MRSSLSLQHFVLRVPQLLPHFIFCWPHLAGALQILVTEMGNMMAQLAAINPVVIRMLHFNPDKPHEGPSRELHESVLVSQARSHDCCSHGDAPATPLLHFLAIVIMRLTCQMPCSTSI